MTILTLMWDNFDMLLRIVACVLALDIFALGVREFLGEQSLPPKEWRQ